MAKISNNPSIVAFDESLLKKQVVARNKKLTQSNKELELNIKQLKAEFKECKKQTDIAKKELDKVQENIKSSNDKLNDFNERLFIAQANEEKALSNKSKLQSSCKELEDLISDARKQHKSLEGKVSRLLVKESERDSINKSLKEMQKEYGDFCDEILEFEEKKESLKSQIKGYKKTHKKNLKEVEQSQADLVVAKETKKAELDIVNKEFKMTIKNNDEKMKSIEKIIIDRNLDLDELDSMIMRSNKELEVAEKKLSVAKNNILEEENKIEKVKENFETWKVTAVEEVARMKLRGKIENIDKAGLKDVLS